MPSPWDMDRDRLGWWVVAFLFAAVIGFVLYAFVGTFVFGVFIYYSTRPIYRRLRRVVRPPSLAAGVALVLITLPAILLLAYTIAVGLQEFNRLVQVKGIDIGQIEALLKPYIDISSAITNPSSLFHQPIALDTIRQALDQLGTYAGFFGNAALHLFVMVLIAFYLLRDDHRLAAWFTRRFADNDGVVEAYARRVDSDFSHIFFGNLLNAVLTGIIGAVSYGALSFIAPEGVALPYPALLGLLTGVGSLVPVVGIKIVYVPAALYLFYLSAGAPALLWFPLLFVLVSFFVVDVIPDLVLRPYVSGRGLHLGMVMLAYIFGPLLFGWYGIFLGPMILVLVVHFASLVLPELLAGTPIVPEEVGESIITGQPLEGGSPDVGSDGDDGESGHDAEDAPG